MILVLQGKLYNLLKEVCNSFKLGNKKNPKTSNGTSYKLLEIIHTACHKQLLASTCPEINLKADIPTLFRFMSEPEIKWIGKRFRVVSHKNMNEEFEK